MEQEFDGTQGDGGGGARDFLFQGQVKEVVAQLLLGDEVGCLVVVFGQRAHGAQITVLSSGRISMQLHIFEESSTQR